MWIISTNNYTGRFENGWLIHEDADDVLQLTYVRIYKGLGKFAFKSTVKTWCYRIAYNESMRFLEINKKRMRISEDYNTYRLDNLYADPYFDVDAADASLQKAINELDNNQREVFCMKYYDELKFAEIAEISNRNENSVKTLFIKLKKSYPIKLYYHESKNQYTSKTRL